MEIVSVLEHETVVVGGPQSAPTIVVTGQMGPKGPTTLAEFGDIDRSDIADGATLIYQSSTNTWKAAKTLDNQIIECGQF